MEIRILTQKDTKIVSVEQIKEIKSEDNSYLLQGKEKDGNIVNLGKYREPHYSNHVMLYIVNEFNKNPNKIIRLPEDDEDILSLKC